MTESDAAPPPPLIAGSPAAAEADPAPPAAAAAAAAPQPPTDAERTAVLRTHGLTRRFGRFKAVDGLSLSVQEGEIYGFLGRNGAGKTTTIRMLMGIIKPGGGQIELLGKRSRRANAKVKRQIGYVSQSQYFYPWMNPVMLGKFCSGFYPTWDHQEYARLLRVLDLPPDRKFANLSGGMRVKLALALALAYRPPLLILDEPTSSLDPVSRREFLDLIENQARNHGRTTFFSTHRIEEVDRVADRLGIIKDGQLQFEGGVAELKRSVREIVLPAPVAPAPPPPPLPPPMTMSMPAPVPPPGGAPPPPPESSAAPAPAEPAAAADLEREGAAAPPPPIVAAPAPAPPPPPPMLPPEPAPFPLPEGARLLHDSVGADGRRRIAAMAPPAWWASSVPAGATVEDLSLEDIFIAIAGRPGALDI